MSKNVKGLTKLTIKLDKLADDETYYKALGQSAAIVEGDAKRKVPVDTGILRSSIATSVSKTKLEARVGTNLEYGPYIEYGTGLFAVGGDGRQTPWSYQRANGQWVTTSGMRAQPFLGPALRENREKIQKHFSKVVAEEMKK